MNSRKSKSIKSSKTSNHKPNANANAGHATGSGTLAHKVAEAVALLDGIEGGTAGNTPALTPIDKKRSARMRKGGDRVIQLIAQLVPQFGLTSEALQPNVMLDSLAQAQALVPLQKRLEHLLKRVSDMVFVADSQAWTEASVGYAALRNLAKKRGDVGASLATLEAFFAARHPLVIAERAQKRAQAMAAKAAKDAELAAAKAAAKVAKKGKGGAAQAPAVPVVAASPSPVTPAVNAPSYGAITNGANTTSGASPNGAALNGASHAS